MKTENKIRTPTKIVLTVDEARTLLNLLQEGRQMQKEWQNMEAFFGKFIGGGFKHCPRSQIFFCNKCWIELMYSQGKPPIKSPMCGEKLLFPE